MDLEIQYNALRAVHVVPSLCTCPSSTIIPPLFPAVRIPSSSVVIWVLGYDMMPFMPSVLCPPFVLATTGWVDP